MFYLLNRPWFHLVVSWCCEKYWPLHPQYRRSPIKIEHVFQDNKVMALNMNFEIICSSCLYFKYLNTSDLSINFQDADIVYKVWWVLLPQEGHQPHRLDCVVVMVLEYLSAVVTDATRAAVASWDKGKQSSENRLFKETYWNNTEQSRMYLKLLNDEHQH